MIGYSIRLKNGATYTTDESGAVVSRSDGPKGWDYSGRWIITGASKRFHSRVIIPLSDIADGADFGQGWVHDIDHGTHRVWGHPSSRRIASVTRTEK